MKWPLLLTVCFGISIGFMRSAHRCGVVKPAQAAKQEVMIRCEVFPLWLL